MPTSRRRLAFALLAISTAAAAPLRAQVFKIPKRVAEPAYWVGGNLGYLQLQEVFDGRTQRVWGFSGALQYRAFLEYSLGRGSSVGVSGSYARMPLAYESFDGSPVLPGGGARVDAHADVGSLMATFHAGGGDGFHYVLDAGLGMTRFARFRDDRTDTRLGPGTNDDFSFSIGTGFGYSTGPRTEFFIVQEYGNVFHERGGLSNDTRTSAQQLTTRLGARFGLGSRRGRLVR